jgi:hypothetical protein
MVPISICASTTSPHLFDATAVPMRKRLQSLDLRFQAWVSFLQYRVPARHFRRVWQDWAPLVGPLEPLQTTIGEIQRLLREFILIFSLGLPIIVYMMYVAYAMCVVGDFYYAHD